MSTPVAMPVNEAPQLSQGERVLNIFFAPTKTFEDIRRNTSWWLPWLLMAIFSMGFVFTVDKKIGFDRVTATQIEKSSRADQFEKLPADQKARQLQVSTNITKYISYAMPIMMILFAAITAAIVMAVFNFGFGQQVPFGTYLSILFYSWLPSLISTVLAVITLFVADPDGYDIRKPVASNLGILVDDSSKFLSNFLAAFDVFSIWIIILIGMGVSANSKVKRSTAIYTLLGLFFAFKLVTAGFSAMF